MASERWGGRQGYVAAIETEHDSGVSEAAALPSARVLSHLSLLRLSLAARLGVVAAASALLWGAVFWATR
jgi:hypothetical protein